MNGNKADWIIENWKEVLIAGILLFVAFPFAVYKFSTTNPKLKNVDSRTQLKDKLAKELKEISLPAKTAVNKFDSGDKEFLILVSTRYRTELGQQEFINYLTQELYKKGWKSYRSGRLNEKSFCREDQKAILEDQGQNGLFGDGGNYYNLSFSVGLINDLGDERPPNCW